MANNPGVTQPVIPKKSFGARLRDMGPAALVTAAFIGPGTITTATLAGANWKYALLWAMLFATIASIILYEMCGRLGVAGQLGLAGAIRKQYFDHATTRIIIMILVVAAVGIGSCAFETGNISGAAMGLQSLFGIDNRLCIIITAVLAGILLWTGSYKVVERTLVLAVVIMTFIFLVTAVAIRPSISEIMKGLLMPSLPPDSIVTIIGLIGTTVFTYAFFMQASAAKTKWTEANAENIAASRFDTYLSISVGGIISMAIIVVAAGLHGRGIVITDVSQMAVQLEPVLGAWARYFLGVGLFVAGLTSVTTAPLATGFALTEIFGLDTDIKSPMFRVFMGIVLVVGAVVGIAFGKSPVQAILLAQAANGILMPISAVFVLLAVNNKNIVGKYTNKPINNILGWLVVLIVFGLGIRMLLAAIGVI